MINLVEGWTERVRCRLLADGVANNLTGASVTLLAYSRTGVALSLAGSYGIETPSTGIVYFDPGSADLKASDSPLLVRWRVTSSGKVAHFPSGAPDQWIIRKP